MLLSFSLLQYIFLGFLLLGGGSSDDLIKNEIDNLSTRANLFCLIYI